MTYDIRRWKVIQMRQAKTFDETFVSYICKVDLNTTKYISFKKWNMTFEIKIKFLITKREIHKAMSVLLNSIHNFTK